MAKLLWAITCQKVLTDSETNSVSYIEAVEQLAVPKLPFQFPAFTVGTLWKRTKQGEPIHIRVEIVNPEGRTVAEVEPPPGASDGAVRHRINLVLAGVPIDAFGEYRIKVLQKSDGAWRQEAELVLDVGRISRVAES